MQRENIDVNKELGLNDKSICLLRQRDKFGGHSIATNVVNNIMGTKYFRKLVAILTEENECKNKDTPEQKELRNQIAKEYGEIFFTRKRDWEIEQCINGITRELREQYEVYPVDDCERSMEE